MTNSLCPIVCPSVVAVAGQLLHIAGAHVAHRQVASRIHRRVVLLIDDTVDSHVCTAAFSIRVSTTASSNLPEFVDPGHMSVHYVQPKWAKLSSGAMNKSCKWFPCQQLQIYQKKTTTNSLPLSPNKHRVHSISLSRVEETE